MPVAVRGTQKSRRKEPGAAAHDGPLGIATRPGAAIVRRVCIVAVAVRHPLPDIAVHVIKPKGIGRKAPHRGRLFIIPLAAAAIAVGPVAADGVAPAVAGARAGPRRVFPFRLARQAIALARLGAQPLRIRPGIRVNIDNALGEKLKSN